MGRAPGPSLGGRLLVVELKSGGRVSARVGHRFLQEGQRRMSLYSDSNEISVPESLIFFIVYHTVASHHVVCGPCGEARACR
ncbi:hypothetical protein BHE74_00053333 [Ensete ventricosum]|nr:hypothetical protein BHE74_00053333 [Ensete ventricosum]